MHSDEKQTDDRLPTLDSPPSSPPSRKNTRTRRHRCLINPGCPDHIQVVTCESLIEAEFAATVLSAGNPSRRKPWRKP
jgi:hypothetical protein